MATAIADTQATHPIIGPAAQVATLHASLPADRIMGIVREGVAHHQRGDLATALQLYDTALRLDGRQFDALNNRGIALRALGQLDAAIACLAAATQAAPERAEGHYNLGNALMHAGRDMEACAAFETAAALDPRGANVWRNLAAVHGRLGRGAAEIAAYRRLVDLEPDNAEWWNNLGAALYAAGKGEAALACTGRATELRPGFGLALKNHGVVLAHHGRYVEAAGALGQAVAAGNRDAATFAALGQALVQSGDLPGATACFDQAIDADGNNLDAQLGAARAAFLRADMARAWPAYTARWRIPGNTYPEGLNRPEWQGEPVAGKTVLVWVEQGIGDTLQFVRYLPALRDRGARVLLVVQPAVAEIVATIAGIDEILLPGALRPEFDFHVPLLNLPGLLGGSMDQIPAAQGYLLVPPTNAWRAPAALDTAQFKIGIVWAGNPTHKNDRNRSVPIEPFLPLCAIPNTAWFSLQVGAAGGQLATSGADALITDLAPGLESYSDTAAALMRLDLVISVDTSVVHLAGALGRPVWCLLPFAPDWRWQLWRRTTPWYRSMRLFRQSHPGDWDGVFASVGRELRDHIRPLG